MPHLLRMSLILKSRCKITIKIAHLQQNHAKVYFQARFCCKWKRATLIFLRVVGLFPCPSVLFRARPWLVYLSLSLRRGVCVPLLVPDILTQGGVLALCFECQLVDRHLVWIRQTCIGCSSHSSEFRAVVFFRLGNFGATFAYSTFAIVFSV